MKITTLGVNSAFATGDYVKSVKLDQIRDELKKLAQKKGQIKIKDILANLEKSSEVAYYPKWQSNFLLEFEKPEGGFYRLIVDFGSDFRHSLKGIGFSLEDIDGYYCSHPHADHIGGIEGIGLSHIFNPFFRPGKADWLKNKETGKIDLVAMRLANGEEIPAAFKPDLYGQASVLTELWSAARPGLETLQGVPKVTIDTYFNTNILYDNQPLNFKDGKKSWEVYTVTSVHVNAGYRQMPSYGLWLESSDGHIIYLPTDTQFMTPRQTKLYYERAQFIYQDCETGERSDVHPHIDDLKSLTPELKKKCYLYHYNETPVVEENEFAGILVKGETHVY